MTGQCCQGQHRKVLNFIMHLFILVSAHNYVSIVLVIVGYACIICGCGSEISMDVHSTYLCYISIALSMTHVNER